MSKPPQYKNKMAILDKNGNKVCGMEIAMYEENPVMYSKSEIIIDLSKGYCDHCEEPKTDINSSYCCKGCEDAEIKFNQLDN